MRDFGKTDERLRKADEKLRKADEKLRKADEKLRKTDGPEEKPTSGMKKGENMKRKLALFLAATLFATVAAGALGGCGGGNADGEQGGGSGSDPAPHQHEYGEWYTVRAPECTVDGEARRECTAGDDVQTKSIDQLGHQFLTYTPTGDATCTEDGTETAKCTRCEARDVRPAPGSKLGHNYDTEHYAADETWHYFGCTRCGDIKEGSASAHTMVNDYECSVCHWHADGTTSLKYSENSDGLGYTVTGTTNAALTKIVIPDTHNGKPVTAVAQYAFRESDQPHESVLREVVFGKNIESIGYLAFGYVTALESVTIPDNVTSLANYAFYGCNGIKTVTIGNGETEIGQQCFASLPSLTDVTIGGGKVTVGKWAFESCPKLRSVTIGDGEIEIVTCAFIFCSALTELRFGNGSVTVGDWAFQQCGLETLTVGDCDIEFGQGGFFRCASLTDVEFGDGDITFGYYTFQQCSNLKTITVGDGDVFFDAYSVSYCPLLTDVTIGDGFSVIGDDAFYECEALTNVTVGVNMAEVGWDAFDYCPAISYKMKDGVKYLGNAEHPYTVLVGAESKNIASVTMSADTKLIMNRAFYDCKQLEHVAFGEHVKKIGRWAFRNCALLQDAVFGDDLTEIENSAFDGCKALRTVTFGNGIQKIGEYAFDGCDAIQTVNVPSLARWLGIEFAADQFIADTNPLSAKDATLMAGGYPVVGAVEIPEGVTALKPLAFAGYAKLTSLQIGKDVAEIGAGALLGCKNVTELTVAAGNRTFAAQSNCVYDKTEMSVALGCPATQIPEGIKIIPANVFREAPLSATFVIPDSVEEIGARAFMSCGTFTDLTLGTGLKTVGESAFFGATASYSVPVAYHIRDLAKWCGVEFANDGANPLRWESSNIYAAPSAGGKETEVSNGGNPLVIPEGVTEIKDYAFWYISTQELHLPASVAKIAPTAFGMNCNLSSYEVAAGNAFYEVRECGVVEKATNTLVLGTVPRSGSIGEGIEKIGDYAFSGKIFPNVSIAADVKEIGAHAFEGCRIETLSLGNVERIGDWAFAKNESSGTGIGTIVIPESVTFIGDSAFYQCGVTSLTLGEKVQHIGENAFAFNNGLTSIEVPASVTELGKGAFSCNSLSEATFGDGNWTVTDFYGNDVTPDFGSPSAVASALKDSGNVWTKKA